MRDRDLLMLIGPLIVAFFGAPTAGRAASFEWMRSDPDYGYASASDLSGDGATVVGECTSGPFRECSRRAVGVLRRAGRDSATCRVTTSARRPASPPMAM